MSGSRIFPASVKALAFILLLALFALAVLPAVAQDAPDQAASQAAADVAVTLERTACFGACPVYRVTIYADGKVVFEGERFVTTEGTQTASIDPQAVDQLIAGFEAAGYFGWKDEYTEMRITDLPTIITSVTRDGATKRITHYAGDSTAPLALPYLETWIDLVANTSQWTGVSISLTSIMSMQSPVMTLERTACYGTCPIYGLAIFADGSVIYLGVNYVEVSGVRVAQVDPDQVAFLARITTDSGYFGWNDQYTRQLMTDHPSAITSLYWEDQAKTIERYEGDPDAPVGLVWFEDHIDALVDSAQWVGSQAS